MSRNEISGVVRGSAVQAETIVGDVHFHQPKRASVGWWFGVSTVAVLVLAGTAMLTQTGWWPAAAVLVLAGCLLEWWLIRRVIRVSAESRTSESVLSALRQQIRQEWTEERNNRGLQDPRPLRLRYFN